MTVLKLKYGGLPITYFNLRNIISQGSTGVNQRVDINESYFVRQTEVYFKNYYHFDRDNNIPSIIFPPIYTCRSYISYHLYTLDQTKIQDKAGKVSDFNIRQFFNTCLPKITSCACTLERDISTTLVVYNVVSSVLKVFFLSLVLLFFTY